MNTAQDIIDVCYAALSGKLVQWRRRFARPEEPWQPKLDGAAPPWDFVNYEYRVVSEPREWWLLIEPGAAPFVRDTPPDNPRINVEIVRVREVVA